MMVLKFQNPSLQKNSHGFESYPEISNRSGSLFCESQFRNYSTPFCADFQLLTILQQVTGEAERMRDSLMTETAHIDATSFALALTAAIPPEAEGFKK